MVLTSTSAFADSDCGPATNVFYAQTMKGHNEVQICNYQNKLIYSYGKIGKFSDMVIHQYIDDTPVVEDAEGYKTLNFTNGDYRYEVGEYLGAHDSDMRLRVYKGKKRIATIMLSDDQYAEGSIRDWEKLVAETY